MKIKIEKIGRYDADKEGKAFVTKNGNKFYKVSIKDEEDNWYSCLDFDDVTKDWSEGQVIDVEVETKTGNNGMEFKNIVLPRKGNAFGARTKAIEDRVKALEDWQEKISAMLMSKNESEDEEDPEEELPF